MGARKWMTGMIVACAAMFLVAANPYAGPAYDYVQSAVSLAATDVLQWGSTTRVLAPSDGKLQVTSSAGAFATLQLGASGAATGIQLVPTNGFLTVNAGDGTGLTLQASVVKGTSLLRGQVVQSFSFFESINQTATQVAYGNTAVGNSGLYFPTDTTCGLSSNGVAALTFDTSQNATFSATVKVQGGGVLRSGAGTPEGAVTGSIGDIFLRTDGGVSTTLYVKQSGATTNTGWVAK